MEAGFVDAGGTRLFVRRWGEAGAPSVLYWHGGGGASDELPRIAPALEAAGYAVYGPDAPGYGSSPAIEPCGYLASNVAAVAAALIDALGLAMAGSNVEPALPLLPRLAATAIPVLLVAATEPPEWNAIRARRIERFGAALPSADVARVQARHGVLQDAGDDVHRIVLDWLSRLD